MENQHQNPVNLPAVIQLWRKAGVDFDCDGKSSLGQLLEIGGYFPLCKVEDRLPLSRNSLYQWSRGNGDSELTSCFMPIRGRRQGRAITILLDLVRLNELLTIQVQCRIAGPIPQNQGVATRPAITQEPK